VAEFTLEISTPHIHESMYYTHRHAQN